MSPFLDADDVKRLTGYEMPSYQLKWCKKNGVQAYLSATGEVIVPRAAIEGRKAANQEKWTPDFTGMRNGG